MKLVIALPFGVMRTAPAFRLPLMQQNDVSQRKKCQALARQAGDEGYSFHPQGARRNGPAGIAAIRGFDTGGADAADDESHSSEGIQYREIYFSVGPA